MKDNIIQFPTHARKKQVEEERDELYLEYEEFTDECRETSQIILMMIEDLLDSDNSFFDEIDFRNSEFAEAKDMMVIVNLISSMLMRYGGVSHFLHDYFDVIYEQIMENKE